MNTSWKNMSVSRYRVWVRAPVIFRFMLLNIKEKRLVFI